MGEERRECRAFVREHPLVGGPRHDPRPLPVAETGADLVLLDHRLVGVRRAFGAAQEGADGGEPRRARLAVERPERRQPPPAGDQAVARRGALAPVDHLDRRLLSAGGDGGLERGHVGIARARLQPVAQEVPGIDGVERQRLDHASLGAGGLHLGGELGQRAFGRALGGLLRDRGADIGTREAEGRLGLRRGRRGMRRGAVSGGGDLVGRGGREAFAGHQGVLLSVAAPIRRHPGLTERERSARWARMTEMFRARNGCRSRGRACFACETGALPPVIAAGAALPVGPRAACRGAGRRVWQT